MPYHIGELEDLTGIPRNTISAWERRYHLLRPRRDPETGRREYSEADLQLLQRVKAAVDGGMRIGQAVAALQDA